MEKGLKILSVCLIEEKIYKYVEKRQGISHIVNLHSGIEGSKGRIRGK